MSSGNNKHIFTKCLETATDSHLPLLSYRATQLSTHLPSRVERLSGRKLKAIFTYQQASTHSNTRERVIQIKPSSAENYNQHAKPLPPLTAGQCVRIRHPTTHNWEPTKVVPLTPYPRSYIVQTPTGHLRHNRQEIHIAVPLAFVCLNTPPDSTPNE